MAANGLNQVMSKISNLIKFCFVSNNNSDALNAPTIQVSYYGKTANALQITPYGFYSNAPLNSLGVVLNVDGSESKLAVIANDYVNRPRNLEPGECIVANVGAGIEIKLSNSGVLQINAPNIQVSGEAVNISAGQITLDDGVSVSGSSVELGGGGLGVARIGDIVAKDPITGIMTIATGSSQVTSG